MRVLFVVLLVLVILFFFLHEQKSEIKQQEQGVEPIIKVPREKPVYIDPPTAYLNEPILYTEWDQEISSSL